MFIIIIVARLCLAQNYWVPLSAVNSQISDNE